LGLWAKRGAFPKVFSHFFVPQGFSFPPFPKKKPVLLRGSWPQGSQVGQGKKNKEFSNQSCFVSYQTLGGPGGPFWFFFLGSHAEKEKTFLELTKQQNPPPNLLAFKAVCWPTRQGGGGGGDGKIWGVFRFFELQFSPRGGGGGGGGGETGKKAPTGQSYFGGPTKKPSYDLGGCLGLQFFGPFHVKKKKKTIWGKGFPGLEEKDPASFGAHTGFLLDLLRPHCAIREGGKNPFVGWNRWVWVGMGPKIN